MGHAPVASWNWISFYSHLSCLYLPDGSIEVAHHDDGVRAGDTVLWGQSLEDARTYVVAEVKRSPDLADLWYAVLRATKRPFYIAGQQLNYMNTQAHEDLIENNDWRLLK